jgi:hypothetical protein
MIKSVGAGLLYRSLREHRRCNGRCEKRDRNGWEKLHHGEHPFEWDLTYVGAATRKTDRCSPHHHDLRYCTQYVHGAVMRKQFSFQQDCEKHSTIAARPSDEMSLLLSLT